MRNVLVRNLPDDIHAALVRDAERRHQSLQQYLSEALTRLAQRPSLDEVLDRAERRRGVRIGLQEAADALRELREGR